MRYLSWLLFAQSVRLLCSALLSVPFSATAADVLDESLVARGEYLATAGNCLSCHTREGGEPYAGGVAFTTPFGTLYSTNITADPEHGIGQWSALDLRRAMHDGIGRDGTHLFPAFPYTAYTKVSEADIEAIHAYLKTVAGVGYTPPDNDFLLRQRWALRIWNILFHRSQRFADDSSQTAQWNRGAYLVEGLGHCGACHTPRNPFMAEIQERTLEGGNLLKEVAPGKSRHWFAVNITNAENGLAAWSEKELTDYLGKGVSSRAGTFGPMNEVIVNSTMRLTDEDVRAMAVYLKSLPGRPYEGATVPEALATEGEPLYDEHCRECHGRSGRGNIFGGPPLAGSAVVLGEDPSSLINVILNGPDLPKEVSFGLWETMRAYADRLTDEETLQISNFVRGSWGNRAPPVEIEQVRGQR